MSEHSLLILRPCAAQCTYRRAVLTSLTPRCSRDAPAQVVQPAARVTRVVVCASPAGHHAQLAEPHVDVVGQVLVLVLAAAAVAVEEEKEEEEVCQRGVGVLGRGSLDAG